MGSVESGRLGLDFGGFQGLKFRAKAKKRECGCGGIGNENKEEKGREMSQLVYAFVSTLFVGRRERERWRRERKDED